VRLTLRKLAALVVATALVGAAPACTSKRKDEGPSGPSGSANTKIEKPKIAPLTGMALTDLEAESRAALAIKIDNSVAARPQAGLDGADIVYEELAEGGITRFMAVFHSKQASDVGPVRSARMVDPEILAQYQGLFAFSGGAAPVLEAVAAAPVQDVSFNKVASAYRHAPGRAAPHNLFTRTSLLWDAAKRHNVPDLKLSFSTKPPPVASTTTTTVTGGTPGKPFPPGERVSISFSTSAVSVWKWDAASGNYLRYHGSTPHTLVGGSQVRAKNVIVQFVQVYAGPIRDVLGNPSPEIRATGSGEVWVLRDGILTKGTWSRQSVSDKTSFRDSSGKTIPLSPGNTWIELAPRGEPASFS